MRPTGLATFLTPGGARPALAMEHLEAAERQAPGRPLTHISALCSSWPSDPQATFALNDTARMAQGAWVAGRGCRLRPGVQASPHGQH